MDVLFWGMIGVCVVLGLLLLLTMASSDGTPTPTSTTTPGLYYADQAADAIRRLGASGAISREDADRIAREHVERVRQQQTDN